MNDDSIRCPKCKTVFHESEEEAQYVRTLGTCLACISERQQKVAAQAKQDAEDAEREEEYLDRLARFEFEQQNAPRDGIA